MRNRILLVDGMALLFRGYYATAYSGNFMKNDAGIATNGVHQFLHYFLNGIETFEPTHVICCWDMGSETFRTTQYKAYKANRGAPPEELVPQFDLVKKVVETFDIPNIGIVNFEADDVIGSLATQLSPNHQVIIQTGDYDMLQLVAHHVDVAIMKKGIGNYDLFHMDNFYEKKGLYPSQIVDFKGFTGDSADNYPGIKGIGEKTATKLLQTYGDMDVILENLHDLSPGIRKKIENDLEMFYVSKELAEIKCDIPLDFVLDDAKLSFNPTIVNESILDLGVRYRFKKKQA